MKKMYWEKISESKVSAGPQESEIVELEKQRKELQDMVDLTKKKYHRREIDEGSFREIVRDYQKKLIELEAKMDEIKSSTPGKQ